MTEYQGGCTAQALVDLDAHYRQIERQNRAGGGEPQVDSQPTQQEYRQTVGPDLDQFMERPEGQAESQPKAANSKPIPKTIPKKKYNLVGSSRGRVESNPRFAGRPDTEWDALSVGPEPPRKYQTKPSLKMFK